MFEWIFSAEMWIALATLIGLDIVLGIDNLGFEFGNDYAFIVCAFFVLEYETNYPII